MDHYMVLLTKNLLRGRIIANCSGCGQGRGAFGEPIPELSVKVVGDPDDSGYNNSDGVLTFIGCREESWVIPFEFPGT